MFSRLKDLRVDHDLKQSDISKILNISKNTYSQYENNRRSFPIVLLILLCKFYNVSADYILELIDYPRKLY